MQTGTACPGDNFPGGITNGAHWYSLAGGMQDYNYRYTNCFEITLELSCCKYPMTATLQSHWNNNKESLIAYMQQVHSGVKGLVKDANGRPVAKAAIKVTGNEKSVTTTKNGEYWRLLLPGNYTMSVCGVSKQVRVLKGRVSRLDFAIDKCPVYSKSVAPRKSKITLSIGIVFVALFRCFHS